MSGILQYWPLKSQPRKTQIQALEWLEEQQATHLILEAPVGSGKSAIGITYSRYLDRDNGGHGDSFILTPQRILQQQYIDSFDPIKKVNIATLYGKSNYQCESKSTTCDIGGLTSGSCSKCPHSIAKEKATRSNHTVLNYKLALTSWAYTSIYKPRKLIIMDECHTLENHLVAFDALTISHTRCEKINVKPIRPKSLEDAIQWISTVYSKRLADHVSAYEEKVKKISKKAPGTITRSEVKELKYFKRLLEHLDEIELIVSLPLEYIQKEYVITVDLTSFTLKRLTGKYAFNNIVVPYGQRFLYMSSTILDKDGFCRDLGIDPQDAAFLSLESEFPVENRPIFYLPQMKMNVKWNDDDNEENRKRMLASIRKILDVHQNDNGIIHTGNFTISKWLVNKLKQNSTHRILHHNPEGKHDRNVIINNFTDGNKKPTVLISPSITEGLDLKDDLGRFAIFVKVPFGFLGDQWIKKRMELSQQWYLRRALIDIIQGGGRVVRSPDDHGVVYILDQSWQYLLNQARYMIPQWWLDSYQKL